MCFLDLVFEQDSNSHLESRTCMKGPHVREEKMSRVGTAMFPPGSLYTIKSPSELSFIRDFSRTLSQTFSATSLMSIVSIGANCLQLIACEAFATCGQYFSVPLFSNGSEPRVSRQLGL